jgi:hypothetical protein
MRWTVIARGTLLGALTFASVCGHASAQLIKQIDGVWDSWRISRGLERAVSVVTRKKGSRRELWRQSEATQPLNTTGSPAPSGAVSLSAQGLE